MVTAEFIKKDNEFIGFKVSGHADFDEYGQDIVCASISSAVQLVCNTITDAFNISADVSVNDNDGISLRIIDHSNGNPATVLILGLMTHIKTLSEDFPKHINLKLTEV